MQQSSLRISQYLSNCRHDDKFLLLLRNSQHNNNTWGLPGGNVEQLDLDLLETARREGTEEMGELPRFEVLTEIKTRYRIFYGFLMLLLLLSQMMTLSRLVTLPASRSIVHDVLKICRMRLLLCKLLDALPSICIVQSLWLYYSHNSASSLSSADLIDLLALRRKYMQCKVNCLQEGQEAAETVFSLCL